MSKVYIMMGLPGSGKSTFLKNYVSPLDNAKIISRDEIRFSLLKDGEDYFSHEEEVKKILWERINNALDQNKDVYVDQTSINKAARALLIKHIKSINPFNINLIFVNTPYLKCLENNEYRIDTKAYVPRGVIRRMNYQLETPTHEEGFYNIYTYDIITDTVTQILEPQVIEWIKRR